MTVTVWWDVKQKKSTSEAKKCVSGKGSEVISTIEYKLILLMLSLHRNIHVVKLLKMFKILFQGIN